MFHGPRGAVVRYNWCDTGDTPPTYAGVVWGNYHYQKLPHGATHGTQNVPVYSRKLPLGANRMLFY